MEDWESNVGKLILKMAEIEFSILQLLWNLHLNDTYNDNYKNMSLSKKTNEAIKIVEKSNIRVMVKKELSNVLHRIQKVTKTRNIVAHNSISLDFIIVNGTPEFDCKVIGSLQGPRLTYHELVKASKEASILHEKLALLVINPEIQHQVSA